MSPKNQKLSPRIDGRLAAYATLAGAALAAPAIPSADANIVYSGPVNIAIPVTTSGVYLNVVTGVNNPSPGLAPGWDVNPWGSSFLDMFNPSLPGGSVYVGDGTGYFNLAPGTMISAASTFTSGATSASFPLNFNSSNNIIGFQLFNEGTSSVDYGWMQLSLGASQTDPARAIIGYAFDDSGASIMAGQVPEPSTMALLSVMAAGALGVRAWRKRKAA